jgi:hypothetical protein
LGAGNQGPGWKKIPFERSQPGGKYHVFMQGASHRSFITQKTSPGHAAEGDAIRGYTDCASLAFWDAYWKADPAAKIYLQSDALPEFSHRLEKSLRLCLAGLRIRRFDPIAEASELADHPHGALLFGLFGDRWAPFFVTYSPVQDQPDQSTLSMGNGPDSLIVSQARYRAAINNFEDASFGSGRGVSSLIE